MSLKDSSNALEKTKENTKLFLFQQKRKLQKLIKMVTKVLKLYPTK